MKDINSFSDGHGVHTPAVVVLTAEPSADFALGIRASVEIADGQRLGRFKSEADAAAFINEQGYFLVNSGEMANYRKTAKKRLKRKRQ